MPCERTYGGAVHSLGGPVYPAETRLELGDTDLCLVHNLLQTNRNERPFVTGPRKK